MSQRGDTPHRVVPDGMDKNELRITYQYSRFVRKRQIFLVGSLRDQLFPSRVTVIDTASAW